MSKCNSVMAPGMLRKRGQYGGNSPCVWGPVDDVPFQLAKAPSTRADLASYRCEGCGYVESYAAMIG